MEPGVTVFLLTENKPSGDIASFLLIAYRLRKHTARRRAVTGKMNGPIVKIPRTLTTPRVATTTQEAIPAPRRAARRRCTTKAPTIPTATSGAETGSRTRRPFCCTSEADELTRAPELEVVVEL